MHFYLDGKTQGWLNTGIRIKVGQTIKIAATGKIGFASGGWNLGPDGKYDNGTFQFPAKNYDDNWGNHPAGDFIKNSLVYKVGNFMIGQGGILTYSYNNFEDYLYVSNNDNYTADNAGGWNLEISTGMSSKHLVIIQDLATDEAKVVNDAKAFASTVFANSGIGHLSVELDFAPIHKPLRPSQYYHFAEGPYVGMIDSILHQELKGMGKDPLKYNSVFFIYKHDDSKYTRNFNDPKRGAITGNTFGSPIMYNGVNNLPVMMSSIPSVNTPGTRIMWSTMVHEYLHQIDVQFNRIGQAGFANPDQMGANTIPGSPNVDAYYANCLHLMENHTQPPYHKLDGTLVYFKG